MTLPLYSQSLTAVYIPNAIAGGGGTGTVGTPYAVFVRIQGWTAAASGQAYLKIYSGSNNEFMWTGSAWSNGTAFSSANQPVVPIDAAGNWSGFIFAKHNDAIASSASVRAAKVGSTSTQVTSSSKTFTILSTLPAGNGGWIFESSSSAINKGVLAYLGGAVVGMYKTEDNGVTEGYTFGPGGFKIAVPAGFVDSLVTINDDGSRDMVIPGPWPITAGEQTDASTGAGQVGHGTARISPSTLSGAASHTLSELLYGESPYTITNAKVKLPSSWSWSHSVADLSVSGGGSPSLAVAGDTVLISGMALTGGDSLLLTLNNITPPDSTARFVLSTRTGTGPDSVYAITSQPGVFVYGIPIPISTVKENDANGVPLLNNRLVTVRGIVTVANEFGGPSYLQDNTGGMAVFGSTFSTGVTIGDEVVVSGLVQPFSGLTEIVNPLLQTIVSAGNTVDPLNVTASQIRHDGVGGVEVFEGRLVRVDNATVSGGGTWTANTNYTLVDPTDSTQLRIDNNTNLVGGAIPASSFDVTGVVGQFVSASPFIGGYQLMPRFTSDVHSAGPVIATFPVESNITATSLRVTWTTVREGSTRLRYGMTPSYESGVVAPDTTLRTNHAVELSGLQQATVYHIQVFSVAAGDTSTAGDLIVSSASPSQTTGVINVYFNKSVDATLARPTAALGAQNLVSRILPRINNARRSIDVALYSLSGTPGPGTDIATALVNAKSRGVDVRVICEDDNRNTAPLNSLAQNGIPLITDKFDPVNAGAGLMHNKFFVIDGRGGAPDSVWVWTGSWNPTQPGTFDDYQNAIEIQDVALAGAYTIEFNEMWGSGTSAPDAGKSRFGARKTDNTPHRFVIGGRNVECYFSPSDRTTSHIEATIGGASHSVAFDLLTLTRSDLGTALVNKKIAGVKVRGVIDDSTDQGSEYNYLVANGVDVRKKTRGITGLLHHKYAVIDGENPLWDAVTVTGSHNWTSAAENANNENLVIIHDAGVANQYLQEFAARYYEFGGRDSLTVDVKGPGPSIPAAFSLSQNYPNPFNPVTKIQLTIVNRQLTIVKVYDVLGQEVATLLHDMMAPGKYTLQFDGSNLASGVYLCRLQAGPVIRVMKMVLMK